jgi:hypothetical protein
VEHVEDYPDVGRITGRVVPLGAGLQGTAVALG